MKFLLTFAFFFILPFVSCCQDTISTSRQDSLDLYDVVFRGRKLNSFSNPEKKATNFSFFPAVGYSLQTGFAGVMAANVAFLTKKNVSTKVSNVAANFTYSQYNQIIFPFFAYVWSKDEKWNFTVEWRYMKYPSQTWGLVGRNDPNKSYLVEFSYFKFHQMVLRAVSKNVFLGTGLFYDSFLNIKTTQANGKSLDSDESIKLKNQGIGANSETSVGIPFRILLDTRQNQINPKNGWFVRATWRYNVRTDVHNKQWQSFVLDIRKYIRLTQSGNVLTLWSYNWFNTSNTPYFLLPSLGWDENFNTGRGYIQGRFKSMNMNYFETEYRFKLSRNGLIGAVVFANAQLYKDKYFSNQYESAFGVGAGLRLKINKHSGTNLCIDFGFGQRGSKGFFVNLGEVF